MENIALMTAADIRAGLVAGEFSAHEVAAHRHNFWIAENSCSNWSVAKFIVELVEIGRAHV